MTPALLLCVAFVTGAAVMVVELMGVRVLAPWFGQSQIVWTNVIGVVLAALACGQWLGGRWAESRRGPGPGPLLVVAGAGCLALPDAVALLGEAVLPADLGLLEAYPFISTGSLLVALLGLGVPMFALGAVTPWLVRLFRESREAPGRVAGRVLGVGTAGSLVGTFGATHVLLGAVGSHAAVRGAGGVLVVAGIVLALASRTRVARAVAVLVVPLVLALVAKGTAPVRGGSVEAEVETVYQWARIEESDDGLRLLRINEGLDSFHSAYRPGSVTTGLYFDAFVLPALAAPRGADGRRAVLVVGLGAGTMARQVRSVDPDARIVGVEIDPELPRLGRRYMGLPDDVVVASGTDGRTALRDRDRRYGAVLVDAYSQQIYLPHHLCTEEFFREVRAVLEPGGVVALNVGGMTREDPVVAALAATVARVFPVVELARVPLSRNWIVLAWTGAVPSLEQRRALLAGTAFEEVCAWMGEAGVFAPADPEEGRHLRDGDAPVEALAHEAWSRP